MKNKENSQFIDLQNALAEPFIETATEAFIGQCRFLPPPSHSLSFPSNEAEARKQLRKDVVKMFSRQEERERSLRGVDLIFEGLERGSLSILAKSEFALAAEKLMKMAEVQEPEPDSQAVPSSFDPCEDVLQNYVPFYKEIGMSFQIFSAMYDIGTDLFQKQAYEDAACVFEVLTQFDGSSSPAWFSAGLCHYKIRNWCEAIANFTVTTLIEPSNLLAVLNLGICYAELNQIEKAKEMLSVADSLFLSPKINQETKNRYRKKHLDLKKKL